MDWRTHHRETCCFLRHFGSPALCSFIAAGLKDSDRRAVQEDWTNGKVAIIVATISFGMGVDKSDVRQAFAESCSA